MLNLDFPAVQLSLKHENAKTYVFDIIRKKWLVLTPEEHVRQHLIHFFVNTMQYPAGLMAIEKQIKVGAMNKRFDIVIYNRDHKPWMLVECKEPSTEINEKVLHQLLNYQRTIQCHYWLLTNGHRAFCANAGDPHNIKWEDSLPAYDL